MAESLRARAQLLLSQLTDLVCFELTQNASTIVEWPNEVFKLIIDNVVEQGDEPVLLFRLDETLKLQLGEQALRVVALALDDLDSERLAADLVHRPHSRLAYLLDYMVLVELAGEALGLHQLPHQTLAVRFLREKQPKSLLPLWMQVADRINQERHLEPLTRRRGEAQ